MHLTVLLQRELFSWSPPSMGRNFFQTAVVPDLYLALTAGKVPSLYRSSGVTQGAPALLCKECPPAILLPRNFTSFKAIQGQIQMNAHIHATPK